MASHVVEGEERKPAVGEEGKEERRRGWMEGIDHFEGEVGERGGKVAEEVEDAVGGDNRLIPVDVDLPQKLHPSCRRDEVDVDRSGIGQDEGLEVPEALHRPQKRSRRAGSDPLALELLEDGQGRGKGGNVCRSQRRALAALQLETLEEGAELVGETGAEWRFDDVGKEDRTANNEFGEVVEGCKNATKYLLPVAKVEPLIERWVAKLCHTYDWSVAIQELFLELRQVEGRTLAESDALCRRELDPGTLLPHQLRLALHLHGNPSRTKMPLTKESCQRASQTSSLSSPSSWSTISALSSSGRRSMDGGKGVGEQGRWRGNWGGGSLREGTKASATAARARRGTAG